MLLKTTVTDLGGNAMDRPSCGPSMVTVSKHGRRTDGATQPPPVSEMAKDALGGRDNSGWASRTFAPREPVGTERGQVGGVVLTSCARRTQRTVVRDQKIFASMAGAGDGCWRCRGDDGCAAGQRGCTRARSSGSSRDDGLANGGGVSRRRHCHGRDNGLAFKRRRMRASCVQQRLTYGGGGTWTAAAAKSTCTTTVQTQRTTVV